MLAVNILDIKIPSAESIQLRGFLLILLVKLLHHFLPIVPFYDSIKEKGQ